MDEYDYAGGFRIKCIGHALVRGRRATAMISAEINEQLPVLSAAERALLKIAIDALDDANKKLSLAYRCIFE